MSDFLLVAHGIQTEIDTTPNGSARTWVQFGNGIENFSEAMNETIQQYFFYSDKGYARNYVTGMAPSYTCSGRRIMGDAAQDFIFNDARKFGLMVERATNFRISYGNADGSVTQILCEITIANASCLGGATTDGSPISFEVRVNGKPVVSSYTPGSTLTVTSVAGTAVGDTKVTVTESLLPGAKFVYAWDTAAPTATVGSVITGWNDFVSGADYTIASGKYVTVAEIATSTNIVLASGNVVVVAKAS